MKNSMFLDDDELFELTGYRYPAMQRKSLTTNGLKYLVRNDGKPMVLRKHIEQVLGGLKNRKKKVDQPNIAGLMENKNG